MFDDLPTAIENLLVTRGSVLDPPLLFVAAPDPEDVVTPDGPPPLSPICHVACGIIYRELLADGESSDERAKVDERHRERVRGAKWRGRLKLG